MRSARNPNDEIVAQDDRTLASTWEQVRETLEQSSTLQRLEEITGLPKTAIFLLIVTGIVLFVFFGIGGVAICNVVGFLYPAYCSYKAVESHEESDDIQWLTYWTVFGFFSVGEALSERFSYWIPYYYPIKFVFLLWCMLPQTRGANKIYDVVIRPFLSSNERRIDEGLLKAKAVGGDIYHHIRRASEQLVIGLANEVVGPRRGSRQVGTPLVRSPNAQAAAPGAPRPQVDNDYVLVDRDDHHHQPRH